MTGKFPLFASLNRTNMPTTEFRMKKALALAALGLLAVGGPAFASADLAKQKNCLACHATDKKLVGPSYKDVAAKYKSDKNAAATLAKKIREGGVGVWGQIPMPANPQVNEQEAQALAKWVLSM
jgi:cytochrome c